MKSILLLGTLFTLWFLQTDGLYKVKLGKAPDCNGFNFCGISANNSDATDAKQENEVLAQIIAKDKFVQFAFLKRTVNDKLFLKYFATGTFILDDDFTFNEDIRGWLKPIASANSGWVNFKASLFFRSLVLSIIITTINFFF